MNILEKLFHEHKLEMFVTDRYIHKKMLVEEGKHYCHCGHTDNTAFIVRGELFRGRKYEKEISNS